MSISKLGLKQWFEIANNTPSNVTTVDFTNIPSVSDILLVFHNVDFSAAAELQIRFNNDTTANYTWYNITGSSDVRARTSTAIRTWNTAGEPISGYYYIQYINSPIPKTLEGFSYQGTNGNRTWASYMGAVINPDINIIFSQTVDTGQTGTIRLYGAYE